MHVISLWLGWIKQDYDAAVGDITIRFYRTAWVDFTMPYSETGVSMLVPVLQHQLRQGGSFLSQLPPALAWSAFAFCLPAAFFFYVLDYRQQHSDKRTLQLSSNFTKFNFMHFYSSFVLF